MRTLSSHLLVLLSVALALSAADEAEVRRLIAELGAEDHTARERASGTLVELGEKDENGQVTRLLEEAGRAGDPEIAERSKEVLATLWAWNRIVLLEGRHSGAFDVETGTYLWRPEKECPYAAKDPRGRGLCGWFRDIAGDLISVDLRTGQPLWTTKSNGWGRVTGAGFWLGIDDARMWRISLDTGRTDWETALTHSFSGERDWCLVATDELIAWAGIDSLCAFDGETGASLWSREGLSVEIMAGDDQALYVVTRVADGDFALRQMNSRDGEVLWEHKAPPNSETYSLRAPADSCKWVLLCIVNHAKRSFELVAIDSSNGNDVWRLPLEARGQRCTPDGRHLWLATSEHLGIIDLDTGKELQSFPLWEDRAKLESEDRRLFWINDVQLEADAQRLYVMTSLPQRGWITIRAYDLASRAESWKTEVYARSEEPLLNSMESWIQRLGRNVVLISNRGKQTLIDVLDASTGRVAAHHEIP